MHSSLSLSLLSGNISWVIAYHLPFMGIFLGCIRIYHKYSWANLQQRIYSLRKLIFVHDDTLLGLLFTILPDKLHLQRQRIFFLVVFCKKFPRFSLISNSFYLIFSYVYTAFLGKNGNYSKYLYKGIFLE